MGGRRGPVGSEEHDMQSFSLRTQKHAQFLDITRSVQSCVSKSGVRKGVVTVFIPHTTAGVTINENADPDVVADLADALEKAVPWDAKYKHIEGNAAAHVKASLMGSSVQVIVEEGLLRLGTWQALYFCEFDGPRSRDVWLQVSPSGD
jgi:secondary thiamine-phosphate synthase enzyme